MQLDLAFKLILLSKLCHQTRSALIIGNYQCRGYSVLNSTDLDLLLVIVLLVPTLQYFCDDLEYNR